MIAFMAKTSENLAALTVSLAFDPAAALWFVKSSVLPGLHVEAAPLDELTAIIADVAANLIEAKLPSSARSLPLNIGRTIMVDQAHAA
jgi:Domain of unknown function (DUF1902)